MNVLALAVAAALAPAAAAQDADENAPADDVAAAYHACVDEAADAAARADRCAEAIAGYTARIDGDGEHPAMDLALRADVQARRGRLDAALADLDRALAMDADYVDRAQLETFRDEVAAALARVGAGHDELRAMIEVYNAGGASAEIARLASAALDQGLAQDADVVAALQARATARIALQEWGLAEDDLSDLIARADPAAAAARLRPARAEVRLKRGDASGALADLDAAVAVDPRPALLLQRGGLLLADGLSGDAAADFEAVLADAGASPAQRDLAQLGVARTWHDVRDVEEAMAAYQAFFVRLGGDAPADPEVQDAARELIAMVRAAGHYDGAGAAWDAEFRAGLRACVLDPGCRDW